MPAEDLQAVVNLGLAIAGLITAIAALPPVIVRFFQFLGKKKSAADLELLRQVATTSVQAIAQTLKTAENEKKLAAAMELASTQLLAYGVRVDHSQLRAAIEAAYLLAKSSLQLPPPPPDGTSEPAPAPVP